MMVTFVYPFFFTYFPVMVPCIAAASSVGCVWVALLKASKFVVNLEGSSHEIIALLLQHHKSSKTLVFER